MRWMLVAHATITILAIFGSVSALADTAGDQTCPVLDLSGIYRLADHTTCPQLNFPTGNRLRIFTVAEVANALAPNRGMDPQKTSNIDTGVSPAATVFFFYKTHGCPYSTSMLRVVQCSALFFSPDIPFIALRQESIRASDTRGGLLLQQLGLNAAPILRIHTGRSRLMKHRGQRTLVDVIRTIGSQNGTGIAPIMDPADVISKCPLASSSSSSNRISSNAELPCWCLPQYQMAVVTADDIQHMAANPWMLVAVLFLAQSPVEVCGVKGKTVAIGHNVVGESCRASFVSFDCDGLLVER